MSFRLTSRLRVAAVTVMALGLIGNTGCVAAHAHPSTDSARSSRPDIRLAVTPPMGWNSWNHFHCSPTEQLIRETADAMVSSGMRGAGYRYVVIDDCWQNRVRDRKGNLEPDPARFPSGIKALADYVHARGLRLGIYATAGTRTCANIANRYPGVKLGSLGHEQQDARQFARWRVDYLKYDWCAANLDGVKEIPAFTKMGRAIKKAGRPMIYSISEYGMQRPWRWAAAAGANLWRTTPDIHDNWSSVRRIIGTQAGLERYAGPGHWNDPDMLQVGNGGMTTNEYRVHFSMWAMLSAPLIAGNDLRSMSEATREMLTNRDVIAIDQDRAGAQAHRLRRKRGTDVWVKPLADGTVAVALLNLGAHPATISTTASELGLERAGAYQVTDLWSKATARSLDGVFAATVASHDGLLLRISDGADSAASACLRARTRRFANAVSREKRHLAAARGPAARRRHRTRLSAARRALRRARRAALRICNSGTHVPSAGSR